MTDMKKEDVIEKAIRFCHKLIDQYDNNRAITDIDLCYLIETLKGYDTPRHCYECGTENMASGYVIRDGEEYYCSEECLRCNYSKNAYEEMHKDGMAYWTQWDEEES